MDKMTVRELIEKLSEFDENLIVRVVGGMYDGGEGAELTVGHIVDHRWTDIYGKKHQTKKFEMIETIMEY